MKTCKEIQNKTIKIIHKNNVAVIVKNVIVRTVIATINSTSV